MKSVTRDHVEPFAVDSTAPVVNVRELPSKFLPYPAGSTVKFKPYSYGELEKVSSTSDAADKIRLVLDGIETIGFSKGELDYQDFIYIMVLRKLSTFSTSQFILRLNCIHCDEHITINQNLNSVEFSEITGIESLPCKISIDNKEVEFNTLTVESVLDMLDNGIEDQDKSSVLKLSYMASNMSQEEAFKIISECQDGETIQVLSALNSMLNFGGQTTQCKCPACSKPIKVTLRGMARIAEPFRIDEDSLRNRIVFGKERNS